MASKNLPEKEINDLIINYLTGKINHEDLDFLKQWLGESKQNKEYFSEIKATWSLANKAFIMDRFDSSRGWELFSANRLHRNKVWNNVFGNKELRVPVWGIAASWIVVLMLGSLLTFWFHGSFKSKVVNSTEIYAPLGARSRVVLPDGTRLWLNAGSKILYNSDFGQRERTVTLTGEAYFNVTSNKNKPFVVITPDIIVKAVGTRFNVKAYPEENIAVATLEEGKIIVQMARDVHGTKKVELKPRENIVYFKREATLEKNTPDQKSKQYGSAEFVGKNLEVQKNIKTELFTSWKEDRWIIESEPLSSLVPKLERRYNIKIYFMDEELKTYKFSGTIRNETAEQIMFALRLTAPLDYKIDHDTIRLTLNNTLKERYSKIITKDKKPDL